MSGDDCVMLGLFGFRGREGRQHNKQVTERGTSVREATIADYISQAVDDGGGGGGGWCGGGNAGDARARQVWATFPNTSRRRGERALRVDHNRVRGRQARSRRPASLQGEAANGKPAASMARCLGASTCRRRTNTVPRQMNFRGAAGDAGCGESRGIGVGDSNASFEPG